MELEEYKDCSYEFILKTYVTFEFQRQLYPFDHKILVNVKPDRNNRRWGP